MSKLNRTNSKQPFRKIGQKVPGSKASKRQKGPKTVNGRPSSYTQAVAEYICQEIMKGRTLTRICRPDNMPCIATVFNWLSPTNKCHQPEFLKSYLAAREIQAEVLADEIVDIADDGENDTYTKVNKKTGETEEGIDFDHIKRSALRVETRKWVAAHLLPRKFGDKVQLAGVGDKPLIPEQVNLIVDFGDDEAK